MVMRLKCTVEVYCADKALPEGFEWHGDDIVLLRGSKIETRYSTSCGCISIHGPISSVHGDIVRAFIARGMI